MSYEIRQGDCRELLAAMEPDSVDMVLADPPYGLGVAEWDDSPPSAEFLSECLRVSRGAVLFFGGAPMKCLRHFIGLAPDRLLIWAPRFSLAHTMSNGIAWRWHAIWAWNLPAKHDGPTWDAINTPCVARHNAWDHPCTKPPLLMQELARICPEGGLVLDPFCGSGSTGVACVNLGRDFLGFEIDEGYCELARKRLTNAQPPLALA